MEENQPITKMCPVTTEQMTEAFQKLYERMVNYWGKRFEE